MIELSRYKDRPMLVLKTPMLTAGFLHQDGGKLATLKDTADGTEFLHQTEGDKYLTLEYDGDYVSSECSGFDDMFPTIDPYTPESGVLEGKTYPDHGEICRVSMENAIKRNGVTFTYRSDAFKYRYQKSIFPLRDGSIEIVYRITNDSPEPLSCLWAGHCMLRGVDGARIFTSYSDETPRVQMFGPDDVEPNDLSTDRLTGYQPGEGYTYKFYYLEKMPAGKFGVRYPDGKVLTFSTDPQKIPYLGVWLNNGTFKDIYNMALEPCTAPYDAPDRAEAHGFPTKIAPNASVEFSIRLSLSRES